MRFTGKEISNLDAISLSNCPKLSDNPRILTVEYTVACTAGLSRFTYCFCSSSDLRASTFFFSSEGFCLARGIIPKYLRYSWYPISILFNTI